ncbi:unnamed protein product [Leuciscus chuanchicus]
MAEAESDSDEDLPSNLEVLDNIEGEEETSSTTPVHVLPMSNKADEDPFLESLRTILLDAPEIGMEMNKRTEDHGFPVTRSLVKILVTGIIKESGRTESTTVNLEKSDVWWSRIKARHPELTSRTAESLDRARVHGATLEAIEGFLKLYEALYVKHGLDDKPQLIYNCDETGFGDKPRSREKVLFQTGRKHIYQQQTMTREHITVHCCVNAARDSIPPFIIYPGCFPSNAQGSQVSRIGRETHAIQPVHTLTRQTVYFSR